MRKFLLTTLALALLALGSINTASAFDNSLMTGGAYRMGVLPPVMLGGVLLGMGYLVYDDISKGGLNRQRVEVVPGAGYQSRDYATAAKFTHEFNVAMAYSDDADTVKYLASAAR